MLDGMGATIMGRNMFGAIRGAWGDSDWRGWWGDVPPYHCPVFVLTHYPRDPIEMDGGTSFHFVTNGIEAAYAQAAEAAGGPIPVATLRQILETLRQTYCGKIGCEACRRDRPPTEPGHPRLGRAPPRRLRGR